MRLATARLLVLAVLVVTVSTLPVFLLGASFFQIGSELSLGPAGLGGLTAVFFLTASITSAPLGRWVQRVGWRRAMRINSFIAGTVLILIGILPATTAGLAMLLAAGAACYGMSNPAANLALADHTDPRWRATVFGIKHGGIPTSTLLAGLAVPLIVIQSGWQRAYLLAALLAGGVALLIPGRNSSAIAHRDATEGEQRSSTPLSTRALVGLAAGAAAATLGAIALGSFGVSASVNAGLDEAAAGWLQFGGSLASIGARLVAGYLTDRGGSQGFTGISILASAGAVAFLAMTLASGAGFAILMVVAFATAWGWPGLMTFTVVNANRGSVAASSAITQAGVFVGAGAGPLVLGGVIQGMSFDAAWIGVAMAMGVAAVVVTLVGRVARTGQPDVVVAEG